MSPSLAPTAGHWRPPLRKVPYDRGFDPEGVDAKKALGDAGPSTEVAWSRSVHDHACIAKNALCESFGNECPKDGKRHRPSFLSQATWKMIKARRSLRSGQRAARRLAVKLGEPPPEKNVMTSPIGISEKWALWQACRIAANAMSRQIKSAVKADRDGYLRDCCKRIAEVGACGGSSLFQRELRPLLAARHGKRPLNKPLPMIKRPEGGGGWRAPWKKGEGSSHTILLSRS